MNRYNRGIPGMNPGMCSGNHTSMLLHTTRYIHHYIPSRIVKNQIVLQMLSTEWLR